MYNIIKESFMSKMNIIQRRELEPLWYKATEVAQHYEKAVDCVAAVIGLDSFFVSPSQKPNVPHFCTLCKRFYHAAWKLAPNEFPCTAMHLESVRDARKLGGSCLYTCPLGFYFWASPFFAKERFAGAMMSSGGIAVNSKQPVLDKIFSTYKGKISRGEISQYLDDVPERDNEDVNALVQMMLLCTENISTRESQWDDSMEYEGRQICTDYQSVIDMERQLIASLRRGDSTEAQNKARELMNDLNMVYSGNFEHFKLKSIELVVLLSRSGANSTSNEQLVEANNRYLKSIMDSRTAEEITENLCLIMNRMAGAYFSFQGIRHSSALRKAERFIWDNYTRKVSLKEIADVSGLSAPYFSTIFKDEMGENLTNFLNRLRVEKASIMLRETESSIKGISSACGFEDQSWFSKIFKSYTGISPGKYREHGGTTVTGQELTQ
jgi:AraC-like DNA-binding protein/ligand-binding sensor protein